MLSGRTRICLEILKKEKTRGRILVDIGSSVGWLEREIEAWGFEKVIGIEPNKKFLKEAAVNAPKAEFLFGDAGNIPVADGYADIVVMFDVIEHVPMSTEAKVFKEVGRILKKGGVLLLSTPLWHSISNILDPAWYFGHRHYSLTGIKGLLTATGFKIERLEVKGDLWASLYMIWFYINKWIFGGVLKGKWLERKYDNSYNGQGFHTIFLKARLF